MIAIPQLIVTQIGLRNRRDMEEMARLGAHTVYDLEFCKSHHHSPTKYQLIQIDRFPNGDCYLRDGLTRVTALWYCGRTHLYDSEYHLVDRPNIEMFNTINLSAGWVTPFDLRTELRLADFLEFKKKVLAMPEAKAIKYINSHRHEYVTKRGRIRNVADLEEYHKDLL